MRRNCHACVTIKLCINVYQRRWHTDPPGDRETESVGLAWSVIRILPKDDHFDLIEWCGVQSGKPVFATWIYDFALVFLGTQERT